MWEQTKRLILEVANKDIPILLKSYQYNFFGPYTLHGPYFQREGNTNYYSEANLIHNAEVGRPVSGLSKDVFYLIKPVNVPEIKGVLKNAFDRIGNLFREERPRWVREEAYIPESRLGSLDIMELSKNEQNLVLQENYLEKHVSCVSIRPLSCESCVGNQGLFEEQSVWEHHMSFWKRRASTNYPRGPIFAHRLHTPVLHAPRLDLRVLEVYGNHA